VTDIDLRLLTLEAVRRELDTQSRSRLADAVPRWAASGAMALTGIADGPPETAPAVIAPRVDALASGVADAAGAIGRRVEIDGLALLGERAAIAGLTRQGSVSVGGAARMVAAADGWLALNLARPEDTASVPALVGSAIDPNNWASVAEAVAARPTDELIEMATLLGLPLAAVPTTLRSAPVAPWQLLHVASQRSPRRRPPLVIDLTSLWAGPLAGSLVAAAGARVIKVEGENRPDGTRAGPRDFFDLLNSGKEMVALDFGNREDRARLRGLLESADLVLEGSRPRVMDALGIDPRELAENGVSWISITGHGRNGAAANRVAFGDDAAVAGGLFVAGAPPRFVADAVADPIAGLAAALVALTLLAGEHCAVVDVPLSRAAAWARGNETLPHVAVEQCRDDQSDHVSWIVDDDLRSVVRSPRHRTPTTRAAPLGANTAEVLPLLRI